MDKRIHASGSNPGRVQASQLHAALEHGLESEGEREGDLQCPSSPFRAKWGGGGVSALVVTNPEKVQLIQPPMTIMGRTLRRFPFSISVIIPGSVIGLAIWAGRPWAAPLDCPASTGQGEVEGRWRGGNPS